VDAFLKRVREESGGSEDEKWKAKHKCAARFLDGNTPTFASSKKIPIPGQGSQKKIDAPIAFSLKINRSGSS
jgi:hypothetical protein